MTSEGEPVGGRWNYDAENRKPLPCDAQPLPAPAFPPDDITREVMAELKPPVTVWARSRALTWPWPANRSWLP